MASVEADLGLTGGRCGCDLSRTTLTNAKRIRLNNLFILLKAIPPHCFRSAPMFAFTPQHQLIGVFAPEISRITRSKERRVINFSNVLGDDEETEGSLQATRNCSFFAAATQPHLLPLVHDVLHRSRPVLLVKKPPRCRVGFLPLLLRRRS